MSRKYCHYFNNDKRCPFSEIGCKFKHEISHECFHGKECAFSLCQYRHKSLISKAEELANTMDNEIVTVIENAEKSKNVMEHLDEISAEENFKPTFVYTSTPKKRKIECGGCSNQSQCEDCLTKNKLMDK